MPQIIPIVAAQFVIEAIYAAVVIAAAVAYQSSEARKAKRKAASAAEANRRDLQVILQTASAPRRTVYGRAKISGPLVYAHSTGVDHNQMHRVVVLTGHEIDGYDKVYFNDEDISADFGGTFPTNGYFSAAVSSGRYVDSAGATAHVVGYPGTTTQLADSALISASNGQWTSEHRLQGCAYLRVQTNYSQSIYTEGLPNAAVVMRGKKEFDNRNGQTVWSDNPAIVIRDYLISELRVPSARIDQASFDAAANLCDEYITLEVYNQSDPAAWLAYMQRAVPAYLWENVSGTLYRQRRYRFNGIIEADNAPGEVLDQMVTSCAGYLSYTGGQWRLVAGGYTAPTITLGESDLRGTPSFRPRPGRRELFNVARGTFVGPLTNYVATDFPQPNSVSLVTADGGQEMPLDIDLPFTNDSCMAQRLGSIFLQRSRQGVLSFPATLTALALRAGDTVAINLPRFGFSGEVFRVEGWTLTDDLGVDLLLREESASIYTWSPDATIRDPSPQLNLPTPFLVPSVTGLSASSGVSTSLVQNDGTIIQRTLVTWNTTTNAFQRFVEIQTRPFQTGAWTPHPLAEDSSGQAYLMNLKTNTLTDIRARRINTIGAVGAWTTIGYTPLPVNAVENMLQNSDWTEDLGYAETSYFNDARALRGWGFSAGFHAGQYAGRNYDGGRTWNIGRGGAWMLNSQVAPGQYQYIYQWVKVTPGVEYEFQVRCANHRQYAYVAVNWYNSTQTIGYGAIADAFDAGNTIDGDTYQINTRRKLWFKGVAPASATYALFYCLMQNTPVTGTPGYTFWHQAMMNVAPTGVTRETATPWTPNGLDTLHGGALVPGSVTDVLENNTGNGSIAWDNANAGFAPSYTSTIAEVSYTNNTASPVPTAINYSALVSWVNSGLQAGGARLRTILNGVVVVPVSVDIYNTNEATPMRELLAGTDSMTVPAGQTLVARVEMFGARFAPGVNTTTAYFYNAKLNVQGIRK